MKTITGSFITPKGTAVVAISGSLVLKLQLKGNANASGVGLTSSSQVVSIPLTANAIPGATTIIATDELTPVTSYICTVVDSNNNVVWGPVTLAISGASPIDLSTLTPS